MLIDGTPVPPGSAAVPVFDLGVQRGFGCFEVARSYGGEPFRLEGHLERLYAGLDALGIDGPKRTDLRGWVRSQARTGGDGFVRVIVTGGSADPRYPAAPRCVVIWEPLHTVPAEFTLISQTAGWIAPWEQLGGVRAKTLSYGHHVVATRRARAAGAQDALLVAPGGEVLEGPNFAVAWVRDGVLEIPTLELGILGSITRSTVLELARSAGHPVDEGRFGLDAVAAASEVMALSTVVEVWPVTGVDGRPYSPGPVTAELAADFRSEVARAVAVSPPQTPPIGATRRASKLAPHPRPEIS